ncbi:MAG TPA: cytosine permease, partial [Methylomirabilota bacterium]|nr:cytosine permease [Methylomirabilota bacterium]
APVAPGARTLGFRDFVVLWGDLGVGLLVLFAGSLLVPALGLPQAVAAIVVGSLVGVTLLALAGVPSSRAGVPTMVALRGVLGVRGSWIPTGLNVVQLLGWTVFELAIMGYAANAASRSLLGWDAYPFWLAVFAALVIALGVWGPLAVVRRFLGRFAVWIMLATSAYLTWTIFARYDVAALWAAPGRGGFPGFWSGVDLVIAMPISWMPLVGDYSRLARRPADAAWGTALGYLAANVWFYTLGALVLLAAGVVPEPRSFVEGVMLLAGPLALVVLVVDETDEAWADLYSCAVSLQNLAPAVSQRGVILGLGVLAFAVALVLDVTRYESFLLLVGSVFVPLFGVLFADVYLLGRRYDARTLFTTGPGAGVRGPAVAAWLAGVVAYHWLAGGLAFLGLPGAPWLGASLPSLAVAAAAHAALGRRVAVVD